PARSKSCARSSRRPASWSDAFAERSGEPLRGLGGSARRVPRQAFARNAGVAGARVTQGDSSGQAEARDQALADVGRLTAAAGRTRVGAGTRSEARRWRAHATRRAAREREEHTRLLARAEAAACGAAARRAGVAGRARDRHAGAVEAPRDARLAGRTRPVARRSVDAVARLRARDALAGAEDVRAD